MLESAPDPTFFESSPPPASVRETRPALGGHYRPGQFTATVSSEMPEQKPRTDNDLLGHLELVREKHILTDEQIDEILNPAALTGSGR
jgi:hypothetical protein